MCDPNEAQAYHQAIASYYSYTISRSYGISDKYLNLFKLIYENSSCNIRTQTGVTDSFNIVTAVRQGCNLSPFLLVIDFVMRKTFEDKEWGICISHGNLSDLDFADDIAVRVVGVILDRSLILS